MIRNTVFVNSCDITVWLFSKICKICLLKVIMESLDELDYEVFHQILDGQNFVPQHRERIIIVGFDRKRYAVYIFSIHWIKHKVRQPAQRPDASLQFPQTNQ